MPLPFNVLTPNDVAPSRKVTVPVGGPTGPVTVAVNVTDCPERAGLSEDDNVTAVGLPLIICTIACDVLELKVPSLSY